MSLFFLPWAQVTGISQYYKDVYVHKLVQNRELIVKLVTARAALVHARIAHLVRPCPVATLHTSAQCPAPRLSVPGESTRRALPRG